MWATYFLSILKMSKEILGIPFCMQIFEVFLETNLSIFSFFIWKSVVVVLGSCSTNSILNARYEEGDLEIFVEFLELNLRTKWPNQWFITVD